MSMLLNPFVNGAGGGGGGPSFSNVIGLWGWEATSPNHLLDESSYGHDLTGNGSFNRATDFSKFGSASAGRTGAGTSSRATLAHNSEFIFSGAFTIEGWVNLTSGSLLGGINGGIVTKWGNAGGRSWALHTLGSSGNSLIGRLSLDGTAETVLTAPTKLNTSQWYHVCLERNSSDLVRLYLDGVVEASATVSGALFNNSAKEVEVGGFNSGGGSPAGYRLDEVRVTKNEAIYNGAFTPPVAAFPRS